MANKVIGKVVTKASFEVDKKGLTNLKKFRQQIEELDRKMGASPLRRQTQALKDHNSHLKLREKHLDKMYREEQKHQKRLRQADSHVKLREKHLDAQYKLSEKLKKNHGQISKIVQDTDKKRGGVGLETGTAKGLDRNRQHMYEQLFGKTQAKQQTKKAADAHITAYKVNAQKVAQQQAKIDEQIAIKTKRAETSLQGVKHFSKSAGDFSKELQRLNEELKRTGIKGMATYRAQVDALVKKHKVLSRSTRTVSQDFAKMRRMVVNLTAAYSAFTAIQNVAQTGFSFEQTESMLQGVLGSPEKAAQEMEYLREVSRQFGSDLQLTAKGYATLSSAIKETNLEQQDARDLFDATSKAAAGFGLSADEASGIMKSLVQTVN